MRTFGIYYRVHLCDPGAGEEGPQYRIAVVTGIEQSGGYWFDPRLSHVLRFRFRPYPGWVPDRMDASSVFGIFGGVENEEQRRVSEAFERNLGDMIVKIIAEIADKSEKDERRILCLGPAFPKAIGRVASLRLPDSVQVAWVTPNPLPDWFEMFPSVYRLQPEVSIRRIGDDPLPDGVFGGGLVANWVRGESQCLVQTLELFGVKGDDQDVIEMGGAPWEGGRVSLPRHLQVPSLALEVCWDRRADSLTLHNNEIDFVARVDGRFGTRIQDGIGEREDREGRKSEGIRALLPGELDTIAEEIRAKMAT